MGSPEEEELSSREGCRYLCLQPSKKIHLSSLFKQSPTVPNIPTLYPRQRVEETHVQGLVDVACQLVDAELLDLCLSLRVGDAIDGDLKVEGCYIIECYII